MGNDKSEVATFASDSRNIRFGLATDGFNPFKDLSSRYSCWPVILTIYNLPPSLCMSKESLMLSLLIPGPKQPGNDIDVYLEPLVDDLSLLWGDGVKMYDAVTKSTFNLKAILMWTIHDFPAYGNVSGWPTKGKIACPICREDTCSQWLTHGRKFAYMGHRRFLPLGHPLRMKKNWFNGHIENGTRPKIKSGEEDSVEAGKIANNWGKTGKKKRKKSSNQCNVTWKKNSIFFKLPYWKTLIVRHNVDVMHVEKNICESIIGTLLDVKGKSKDGINSRKDMEAMNIRHELHHESRGDKFYLPAAPHTLSKAEKLIFCKRLAQLKLPDGYGSNIGNCISVDECKIVGLKSHDCHILMQQLLSVALRGLLPNGPRNSIFKLCSFFNEICQGVIDRNKVEQLEEDVCETLCLLERMHMDELMSFDKRLGRNETLLHKKHIDSFADWLDEKIKVEDMIDSVSNTLKWLARGPRCPSMSYSSFVINGLRFHTKDAEKSRQNSGILVEATTICRSSAKDNAHVEGKVVYYEVLRDVIVLDYNMFHVPIFKCDWTNIVNGVKREDGFTLVNLHEGHSQFQNDPFILASQAKQLFYSRENETSNWYVALQAPPRGFHTLNMEDETTYGASIPFDISHIEENHDDDENYARIDVDGILCAT
ncbi:Uncharacterized protein Adt_17174 [Abeliophyllum distichum]|uniref:DUF4216 domain-containing protein n=1 Tax=Abeliophyllum distichum TaxID=126358 RepID=A0ABD1TFP8_9LAMI